MTPGSQADLESWMAWLREHGMKEECTCPYEWRHCIGRLYGQSMGAGWVRMPTRIGCLEHDGD